jgi:hypothetical protein
MAAQPDRLVLDTGAVVVLGTIVIFATWWLLRASQPAPERQPADFPARYEVKNAFERSTMVRLIVAIILGIAPAVGEAFATRSLLAGRLAAAASTSTIHGYTWP